MRVSWGISRSSVFAKRYSSRRLRRRTSACRDFNPDINSDTCWLAMAKLLPATQKLFPLQLHIVMSIYIKTISPFDVIFTHVKDDLSQKLRLKTTETKTQNHKKQTFPFRTTEQIEWMKQSNEWMIVGCVKNCVSKRLQLTSSQVALSVVHRSIDNDAALKLAVFDVLANQIAAFEILTN